MSKDELEISPELVWQNKLLMVPTAVAVVCVLSVAAVLAMFLPGMLSDIGGITAQDWTILATSFFALLLLVHLISAWSLIATKHVLQGDPVQLNAAFSEGLELFPRLIGMRFIIAAIILFPFAIIAGAMLWMLRVPISVPFLIAPIFGLILLVFVFLIYASIRFIYAAPVLVMEHQGIGASIRRALHISGHHFWRSTGVVLFLAVIGYVAQAANDQSAGAIVSLLTTPSSAIWVIPVLIILVAIESFIAAYEHMFLFTAYRDIVEK